jgi:glucosamine--fructose-6-phosphate aminotransferase (isomerizing)
VQVQALKASEFSGFAMSETAADGSMADALVVAISQSGTTTDTNRSVDMVRERGARTLAIVNRRDSDLTFKVDGVIYTSSGRDIEMSVASRPLRPDHRRSAGAAHRQLKAGGTTISFRPDPRLLEMPDHMRRVLAMSDAFGPRRAAGRHQKYWATVGSGPNKIADESASS